MGLPPLDPPAEGLTRLLCLRRNSGPNSNNERKKLGVQYCEQLLIKKNKEDNLNFFYKSNKKDDLADCFLQSIYYLKIFNNLII